MVTPGSTAPDASRTTPAMAWGNANVGVNTNNAADVIMRTVRSHTFTSRIPSLLSPKRNDLNQALNRVNPAPETD
jgi:hypothetical protein